MHILGFRAPVFPLAFILCVTLALGGVQPCALLTTKTCKPCEGGVPPYSESEAIAQLALVKGWKIKRTERGCLGISRNWYAKNFKVALDFLQRVGVLADSEGHHPDLHLIAYRNLSISLSTHAICGLSENDFILAAKINQIPIELKSEELDSLPRPGRVHMLSGMISSGKSTYAARIQATTGAVVFSPDDWILALYGEDFPVERFQEHGDAVKKQIWEIARDVLARGIDVVLDFSFWDKAERQEWRDRVEQEGASSQLYYLQCPVDVLRERLRLRNARVRSGEDKHFLISESTFDGWVGLLQPPGPDEQPIVIGCES